MLQRLSDEEVGEIRRSKPEKKRYEAAQTRYSTNFGSSGPHKNYHSAETWAYFVEAASSLADLEQRIAAVVKKAEDAAATPITAPVVEATKSISTVATTTVQGPPPVRPPKTKKPPKENLAASYFTATPSTVQEIVNNPIPATNTLIQTLIAAKPTGSSRVMSNPVVKTETVYFTLRVALAVRIADGIRYRDYYNLEVHFHPVPTTPNFLHVKRSAASDAGNTLGTGNWLINPTVLQAGRAAWNAANPHRLATH